MPNLTEDKLLPEYMHADAAADYLLTTERKLALYRKYNLIKWAKLGKSFIYRKQWLDSFMESWSSCDLSNEEAVKLAVSSRKWREKNHA